MLTPQPQTVVMFSNYQLTANAADTGRLISFGSPYVVVGVVVAAVTGTGAQSVFKVQWSNDNVTWTDDPSTLATVTAPGMYGGKFQVAGLYWRLAATVTGTSPVITCSAGAVY